MNASEYSDHINPFVTDIVNSIDNLVQEIIQNRDHSDLLDNVTEYDFQSTNAEHKIDECIQKLAWIHDAICKLPYMESGGYKKSLKYKIRKALGYTYP